MKLSLLVLALAACGGSSTPPVTVQDGNRLGTYQDNLSRCQAVGRDAGTYSAYEACTKEAGL